MAKQRLTYDDVEGVFSIMPTPATPDASDPDASFTVDLQEAETGAKKLVSDDVDAIMLTGTFGEAATLTDDEWRQFTKRVVDTVDGAVPVIAGPTTLNTRTTIDRARYARDIGADGLLMGRPMWCELSQEATYRYYRDVADAVPELGIVVYHNTAAFKNVIEVETWKQLAEIPAVVATKFGPPNDLFRAAFAETIDDLRFMTLETLWYDAYESFPEDALACWSGNASAGPEPVTRLRDLLFEADIDAARDLTGRMRWATESYIPEGDFHLFSIFNIPIAKMRFDEAGYITAGPARPPYHHLPDEFEESARLVGRRWRTLVEEVRNGEY